MAVAGLALLARKMRIPYPILFVIGGLVLGFIPGLPPLRLDPDLVFLLFLPPLLYPAALLTSWRDFRILIGLQLPQILGNLSGQSLKQLIREAALLNFVLIFVRIAWIFGTERLRLLPSEKSTKGLPVPNWRHTAIVAWTGMKGVDSMAAAMALPLTVSGGYATSDSSMMRRCAKFNGIWISSSCG